MLQLTSFTSYSTDYWPANCPSNLVSHLLSFELNRSPLQFSIPIISWNFGKALANNPANNSLNTQHSLNR
ncbi:unnamed protein product [Linum trigynum]|uniref:Uncharacterized protein n=1 Tax=Linum trigynum TaxID=586398 RepID=A0AAV2D6X7_9ROSI